MRCAGYWEIGHCLSRASAFGPTWHSGIDYFPFRTWAALTLTDWVFFTPWRPSKPHKGA